MKRFVPLMAAAWLLVAARAKADGHTLPDEGLVPPSPERFAAEFRIGLYQPPIGPPYQALFESDRGPLVAGEIDAWAYRIPYVGLIGPGFGFGWAKYVGHLCAAGSTDCSMTATEKATFRLYPMYAAAVLRIDALARYLDIPFVFTGKAGVDYWRFHSSGGGEGNNFRAGAWGFHWAAQIALELDVFERSAANRLDAEWGINHSYLFFELYGSTARDGSFTVGDSLAWVAGLGLTF